MSVDHPTVPSPPPVLAGGRQLWLMVMTDDGLEPHLLPPSGRVTIGRDAACGILVEHHSVSRQHATLTIGDAITVEDHGSVNGTHVAGVRIARDVPAPVRFGELFHVGAVALFVQQAMTPLGAPGGASTDTSGGTPIDVPTGAPTGASPAAPSPLAAAEAGMRAVHALLAAVAPGDLGVLLLGETGVGKEVTAELLHRLSPRRAGPLVKLNCGALPEALLESELFGHEKGAFSGAVAAKPGLLSSADGGTVFLDEVGELPLATQVKLLRVLEERAVRPVGALRGRPIDVRFVAATNRELEAEIERGTFRADLYYRLAGATVTIPPLRDRGDELAPLAATFAAAAAQRLNRVTPIITAETLAVLRAYPWPGNVRELRNVIERAVLLCGGTIEPAHLPDKLRAAVAAIALATPKAAPVPVPAAISSPAAPSSPAAAASIEPTGAGPPAVPPAAGWWDPQAAALERARIIAALEASGGHQSRAAALLGISRRTLLNRLDALDLPRPRKGK